MVEAIASTSLLGFMPLNSFALAAEFRGKRVVSNSYMAKRVRVERSRMLTIKAPSMELAKEAYIEQERMFKGTGIRIDTDTHRRPGIWPAANRADDPKLHNPLLRQERMGCGWLCAILEWEGVIVESRHDLEKQAWIALSQEEGKPPPPTFVLKRIEAMKSEQAISEVLCWSRDTSETRRLASRKEDIYQALESGIWRIRSGSREFMNTLMTYKIPMALVSTRPKKAVERVIRAIGLEGCFDVIVAAEDVHRGKPDPEMFECVSKLLKLVPERCIVFGDSNKTVEAAREARMKCVAVASKDPVYELSAADLVVRRLDELSIVDLKRLADLDSGELEVEMEMEEVEYCPRTSVAEYDIFW